MPVILFFAFARKIQWTYIFRFKEGRIPSIASESHAIKEIEQDEQKENFPWVNDISYGHRLINLLEACLETESGILRKHVVMWLNGTPSWSLAGRIGTTKRTRRRGAYEGALPLD